MSIQTTERRRARRYLILDQFSFFAGFGTAAQRVRVHDVSDLGIAIDFDSDFPEKFLPKIGAIVELDFHFNQSFFLPLSVRVVRAEKLENSLRFGAEFTDPTSKEVNAFAQFIKFIDAVSASARPI